MIGNEEDFTAALGFQVEGMDEHHSKLDIQNFRRMIERATTEFPNFQVVATTLRNAKKLQSTTGAPSASAEVNSTRHRSERIWKSSIVLAAAIHSPPV